MFNFFKKISKTFKQQCPSTKILLIIGLVCLINTALTIFFLNSISSPTDVAIRSTMSSIFGYIFGEHCKANNFGSKGIQVLAAGVISIICLLVIIILHWTNPTSASSSAVELRNLLFTTVGFLISKAKNLENNSCDS